MDPGRSAAAARLYDSYGKIQKEILAPGPLKRIGNYQIVRGLASGSFSTVYLAYHILTRLEVVLKSAPKTTVGLACEIANLSELRHPHIIRLWEIVVLPDAVWLALEYCPGHDLYARIHTGGALPESAALRVFAQICGAVAYAHQQHIAHRDLKLENVLLDEHGTTAKLADFGFTRNYGAARMLETICGTAPYMAPELFKRQKYDPEATDAWALGVVLYALIYGKLPFDEENEDETRIRVTTGEPDYLEGTVSLATIDLLRALLDKDPKARPRPAKVLELAPVKEAGGAAQLEILSAGPEPMVFPHKRAKRTLKAMALLKMDLSELASSLQGNTCDPLYGFWYTALERQRQIEELQPNRHRSDNRSLSSVRRVARAIARTPEQLGRGSMMLVQSTTTPRKSTDTSRSFMAATNPHSRLVSGDMMTFDSSPRQPHMLFPLSRNATNVSQHSSLQKTLTARTTHRVVTSESARSRNSFISEVSGPFQRLARRLANRKFWKDGDIGRDTQSQELSSRAVSSSSSKKDLAIDVARRVRPIQAHSTPQHTPDRMGTEPSTINGVNRTGLRHGPGQPQPQSQPQSGRYQSPSLQSISRIEGENIGQQNLSTGPCHSPDMAGFGLAPQSSHDGMQSSSSANIPSPGGLGSSSNSQNEKLNGFGTAAFGLSGGPGTPLSRSILIPRSMSQISSVSQMSQLSGVSDHSRDSFSFTAFLGRINGGTCPINDTNDHALSEQETPTASSMAAQAPEELGDSLWNWLPGHAARKDFRFQRKRIGESSALVENLVEEVDEVSEGTTKMLKEGVPKMLEDPA